jgi:non-canonical (house-cleaning) NTP pyrophosphatase
MKVTIGTTNQRKISSLEEVLRTFDIVGEVTGVKAESNVSETPLDIETKTGAINRARHAQQLTPDSDLWVGVESGLEHRYGNLYEEVWVAMIYQGEEYYAYSSGILVPNVVTHKLETDVSNHPQVMGELRQELAIEIDEQGVDTWGDYTGGMIGREVGLKEALRNTLVQIFAPPTSLYRHHITP